MGGKAIAVPLGVRLLAALGGLFSLFAILVYLDALRGNLPTVREYPVIVYFLLCLSAGVLGGLEMTRRAQMGVLSPGFVAGLFGGLAVPTALTMAPLMLLICLPFAAIAGWIAHKAGGAPNQVAVTAAAVSAGFAMGAFPILWLNSLS
jgi:hypothetical protein